jgi:hypothetical protein
MDDEPSVAPVAAEQRRRVAATEPQAIEPDDDDEFTYGYFVRDLWRRAYRETHPRRGGHAAAEGIWFEEMDPSGVAAWSEAPAEDAEHWRQFAAWVNRVADALENRAGG